MKDIIKLGIFLSLVATISAGALSMTYIYTRPKIEAQKAKEINEALSYVMPEATGFREASKQIDGEKLTYYVGSVSDKTAGVVFPVSSKGYAGPIDMMVGIKNDGRVSGTKIITLTETPGLGSNAASPAFLDQFKGKSAQDSLKAKMDINAITGATITSQAVANGVREALEKFKLISPIDK